MSRFYFFLWLFWLLRVTLCTLASAGLFAFIITLSIYMKQGLVSLDSTVVSALLDIWNFWFTISLNIGLLFALFRSVKYLFNRCYGGFVLKLNRCIKENTSGFIEEIGYGDLIKVWRKWFMILIWLVGSLMVISLGLTYLFTSYSSLFDWFNIYILYLFIAIGGYISFIVMAGRCKSVRIIKC